MALKTFLQKNAQFLVLGVFAGGVLGAALMGIWGYQYGWQRYLVEGHITDISRPEDSAVIYSFMYGFRGCIYGVLIGPLAIVAGYFVTHYMSEWKINRQG